MCANEQTVKQKRIVVIQDISCTGRCSATVALPILSCAGLETSVLPTVVLSTHTAFPGLHSRNLTDLLLPTVQQWHDLGFTADAVYIGYLGSVEQTELIRRALPLLCGEETRIYLDPVMGDGGRLYNGMDPAFPRAMRAFCGAGQVILPNITEACLLCGVPYREGPQDPAFIRELLEGLQGLGQQQTVLTGVMPEEGCIGAAAMDCRTGDVVQVVRPRLPVAMCGTGDVFASAFIGAQMNGRSLEEALGIAEDFVCGGIRRTLERQPDLRRGVNFEEGLGEYIRMVRG